MTITRIRPARRKRPHHVCVSLTSPSCTAPAFVAVPAAVELIAAVEVNVKQALKDLHHQLNAFAI